MYQYAEEKFKSELEKQKVKMSQINQELKEIREKLGCITSYNSLDNDLFNNVLLSIACIVVAGICISPGILVFVKSSFLTLSVGVKMLTVGSGLFGALLLLIGKHYIGESWSTAKEMKSLKKKGVKNFKKQRAKLFDKKLSLEKEASTIQGKMDKITGLLDHIAFFKETMNNPFYQADIKEEYEAKLKYEKKLDDDFSKIIDEDSDNNLNLFSDDVIPGDHEKSKIMELK